MRRKRVQQMLDRLDLVLMRRQLGALNSGSGAPIAVLEEGSNGRALPAPEAPVAGVTAAEVPVAAAPVAAAPVAEGPVAAAPAAEAPVAGASAPESPAAASPADRATRWLLSEHGAVRAEAASVPEAAGGPDPGPSGHDTTAGPVPGPSARETKAGPVESPWAPTESPWGPAERPSPPAERPSAPAGAVATSISLPAAANGAAATQPGPADRPLPPEVSRWLIADHRAATAQAPAPEHSANGAGSWSPDAGGGSSSPIQPASSPSAPVGATAPAPVGASAPDDSLGARAKRWSERVRRRGLRR